jgi:nucleoside-diphosphate-sugar epimerase
MRTLIAGCGYVGLAVGAELTREGHQVWGLRRTRATEESLRAAGLEPITADITQPESLARVRPQFDWVVNCASASGGGVEQYKSVYLEGTRNLLAWLAAAPTQKFVYTSSTSVYGQTDDSLVDEQSRAEPVAETGRVLREAERLLLAPAGSACRAVILRVAGIYGPGRGYWLQQFLSGEARLEGDGGRVLNMVHRDDVAGAVIAALKQGRAGEIYNVVDNEPVTQLAVYEWLSQKLGRAMPPSTIEMAPRKRGLTTKRVSNRRLRKELGYSLSYPSFREGYSHELERH